ncbi:MAG: UDP-N-acetyl-D-glucosamine 2-epimerase, UDP-hydrolysing [Lentisphaerae bacterium RIFOXYB12_FULL_65_16]|nr:MAG: UDP-N-acetyl-D-glucosamine 2-epimerase, UDP-hydrolysing [Lentisphaerae bacterium RIFOXYA12_64_32]OGV90371.1 MAG: UDP-N-acetyl-D-glucosamine 2-epimerase, UDP-hydrolysing [Lentisphaerae bacterium RIFOXYB12_FULL_65_16]
MNRIGVITFARSDYSSCLPILSALTAAQDMRLLLIVGGAHLAPEFGRTVGQIEADGFPIADRIEMLVASDTASGTVKSVGLGLLGLADSLTRLQPEILLMVGDRMELLAAATAALALRIPVAHVSGGDETEGALDNQVRHAVSKMSHLHFVAMQAHADRLRQMGEEPWRITVTGDPALDLLRSLRLLSRAELAAHLGIALTPPVIAVCHHPTTLSVGSNAEIAAVLDALGRFQGTFVLTQPNPDPGNQAILERMRGFAAAHPTSVLCQSLGQLRYYSLLACADVMVGNSSSGIWEAPSFELPVVNIGDRQAGRLRAANVIDVPVDCNAIATALGRALDPAFRNSLRGLRNPYGDGHASARIVEALRQCTGGPGLLRKAFQTL